MNLTELSEKIKKAEERTKQLKMRESELLEQITATTSIDFAERVAKELDPKKHIYNFCGYLELLSNLTVLLKEGIPKITALEAVQTGLETEKILYLWRHDNDK